jgi:hypothetical protein
VIDIKSAFTTERIKRDVYVWHKGRIKQLMFNLYGLSDAPRVFHDGLVEHLKAGNYKQSVFDQCLFYRWVSWGVFIYIILHMDDFHAAASKIEELDRLHEHLNCKYETTVKDASEPFLGIGSSLLTKAGIMQKLFETYLPTWPYRKCPDRPMSDAYIQGINEEAKACDVTTFLSLNGLLIQLLDVRPDIAFAISKVSQKQKAPTERDYDALIDLVHYLWDRKDWGICLKAGRADQEGQFLKIRAYADAAYAVHWVRKVTVLLLLRFSQRRGTRVHRDRNVLL